MMSVPAPVRKFAAGVSEIAYFAVIALGIWLVWGDLQVLLYHINSDIFVNSVLHPFISVQGGGITNSDFTYSNGDHRLIGISLFHLIPAWLFPDDPWAVYFWGRMISSALLIILMTFLCRKFKCGLPLTFVLILFIAMSPGYQYFEHVHAQGSYIFTHYIIPSVLAIGAFTFLDSQSVAGGPEGSKPGLIRFKTGMGIAAVAVIIAMTLNASRGIVNVAAPVMAAYIATLILTRTRLSGRQAVFIKTIVLSAIIGLGAYIVLKSTLSYTMGAAGTPSLSKWAGQGQVLTDMKTAWSHISYWDTGTRKYQMLRRYACMALAAYLFIKSAIILWRRQDRPAIFIILYLLAVSAALALAFNFANIKPAPRYILPMLLGVMMIILAFSLRARQWEKLFMALCIGSYAISSISIQRVSDKTHEQRKAATLEMRDYLETNDARHGVATWGSLGALNMHFGVRNFSPTTFASDGMLSEMPFSTGFYSRDFKDQSRSALIFPKKHPRDSIDLETLKGVLSANGLKIVETRDLGRRNGMSTVVLIDGDVRTLKVLAGQSGRKIIHPVMPKAKTAGKTKIEAGKTCPMTLRGDGRFSYLLSFQRLYKTASYELKIVFDTAQNPAIAPEGLSVQLLSGAKEVVTEFPYTGETLAFKVPKDGLYAVQIKGAGTGEAVNICSTVFSY